MVVDVRYKLSQSKFGNFEKSQIYTQVSRLGNHAPTIGSTPMDRGLIAPLRLATGRPQERIGRFIKLVKQAGLYVHLQIGPYVCAEWNFGGIPVWLKYVPGISFRIDNGPYKVAMEGFTKKIVDMMKAEGLYQSQGGPIIMSQ
ncbi:hypothetical protein MRB53_003955 [Persea americana]|uniref:Uncharacterized protein n=1 Tax=Persea americana TaxID=3435 RepID=A0ACC2MYT6_PERAE|nr:hypothetical protein MRB53_003955 [Persea americana]